VRSKETACREQIKIVRAQLKLQPNDPELCETLAQLIQDLEHFQERVEVMKGAAPGLFGLFPLPPQLTHSLPRVSIFSSVCAGGASC
jgi:hypothetical protein